MLHLEEWIMGLGSLLAYIAYFSVIFIETGLLVGFFLPGDSFLFAMGIFASQGHLSYPLLMGLGVTAAITGDAVGYQIGRRYGRAVFSEDRSRRWLNRDHLEKAERFYEKHGVKTIVLARFTPVVRTFAPVLAGVSKMDYKLFATYNVIGGVFWVVSLVSMGYFMGRSIPNIDRYVIPIIALIIVLSILPAIITAIKERIAAVRTGKPIS